MSTDDEAGPFQSELLHIAARHGNVDDVRRLLSEGHDLNAFDDLGMTPLHYAAQGEHFEAAQCLIEHGANVDARHEPSIGNTPLSEIAGNCSLRIAKLLIDSGADPTIRGWMQLNALDRAKNRNRGDGPLVFELFVRASRRRNG